MMPTIDCLVHAKAHGLLAAQNERRAREHVGLQERRHIVTTKGNRVKPCTRECVSWSRRKAKETEFVEATQDHYEAGHQDQRGSGVKRASCALGCRPRAGRAVENPGEAHSSVAKTASVSVDFFNSRQYENSPFLIESLSRVRRYRKFSTSAVSASEVAANRASRANTTTMRRDAMPWRSAQSDARNSQGRGA